MASVPCAIELEPKTLSPIEINHARELAVVIEKIEPQALISPNLFIQGLEEALENDVNPLGNNMVDQSSKVIIDNNIAEASHNCLCANLFIDSPDTIAQKEPLTAPF